MSPLQKHNIHEEPENKSMSPNTTGKQRYTHLLPNQMSGFLARTQAGTQKFSRQNGENGQVRPFDDDADNNEEEKKGDPELPPTFRMSSHNYNNNGDTPIKKILS